MKLTNSEHEALKNCKNLGNLLGKTNIEKIDEDHVELTFKNTQACCEWSENIANNLCEVYDWVGQGLPVPLQKRIYNVALVICERHG